jgi:hypothetical protein
MSDIWELTNQNYIREELRGRLNSGSACYRAVQNILSSRLKFKSMNIEIYATTIVPALLHGCKTWSLALREGHGFRVFENRVLRRIFGPKRDEVTRGWRNMHTEKLHNLYSSQNIIMIIKSRSVR